MSRRHYDSKTLAVFDHVGCFFVEVFYNDLYLKADDMLKRNNGPFNSLTEAYRTNVLNYMRGINIPQNYMVVIKKLHEYYQKTTAFMTLTFADFEDKVLAQFIPPEYYRDFTSKNKDKTLHDIIIKTVSELGAFILKQDKLRKIIDEHRDPSNITMLQDYLVDLLIEQRETYYSKFADEISRQNGNDKYDREIVNKLKAAFTDEKQKRIRSEEELERAKNIIGGLIAKLREANDTLAQLMSVNAASVNAAHASVNAAHVSANTAHASANAAPVDTNTPKSSIMSDLVTDSSKYTKSKKRAPSPPPPQIESEPESDSESESEEIRRKQQERARKRTRQQKVKVEEPKRTTRKQKKPEPPPEPEPEPEPEPAPESESEPEIDLALEDEAETETSPTDTSAASPFSLDDPGFGED